MKKITFLLIVICTFGCKQKIVDNLVGFAFDSGQVTDHDQYFYEYDGNRLISEKRIHTILMFGQAVDATIFDSFYEYDQKGLLRREITNADDQLQSYTTYSYNEQDSMISSCYISAEGDTSYFEKFGYFPDGKKIIFRKTIHPSMPDNPDFDSEEGIAAIRESMHKKDTMEYSLEYVYENNLCKTKNEYDTNQNLKKVIHYEYKDNRLAREEHYDVINKQKHLNRTRKYDYSKSQLHPDVITLNPANEIIEKYVNELDNGELISMSFFSDNNNYILETYYQDGKEIGLVTIDKNAHEKRVDSFSYYDNGDFKETKHYTQALDEKD